MEVVGHDGQETGFEPTYEGWKHRYHFTIQLHILVLSLPMRDGNSPKTVKHIHEVLVLSLPMRDGNQMYRG